MPKYTVNHTTYYNSEGKEVPSVTTIIKLLNKPSLVGWANYMGFKRISVDDIKKETSEFGNLIHDIINHIVNHKKYDKEILLDKYKVYSTLNNFLTWYNNHKVEPILTEEQLSTDKFGGTVDFYGIVDGKYTIIDFKTSKAIHLSMFIQLALYCILLELKGHKVEQVMILAMTSKKYDYKILTREELDKYIKFAQILVELFHYYYDLCISGKWNDFNQLIK